MKTESHSIDYILSKNSTSFFIPPFQRSYAWGKSEIERFYSDILRIIDSELDEHQIDKLEHFFGTIVIKDEKVGFATKSILIDGQQRLTTTLIFLIALRDSEKEQDKKDYINSTYLFNQSSVNQDKIKLKQVTKDWESYRNLVNNVSEEKQNVINDAYNQLLQLLKETKNIKPNLLFDHYVLAIQKMNVAVIFLDERPFKGEDPQIIFETLNSLGKPLTFSDLIRNYVLLKLNSNEQTNVYENTWFPKIEDKLQNQTSKFLRDYLQLKTNNSLKIVNDNNTKELYHIFKEFVEKNFINTNEFIEELLQYVDSYKWIVDINNVTPISKNNKTDNEIKELLRNIFHDIKAEAFKPFVLGLLKYYKDISKTSAKYDTTLVETLINIRTYLIRRRVLGLTQGENKIILTLSVFIENIFNEEFTIFDKLSNLIYKLRLPNDIEISKSLEAKNFYNDLKNYSKFILGKIEENNSKVSVDFRDPKITIEHIMPQTLTKIWEKELGSRSSEIHKKFLNNIGNLILTEFNSEMGNKDFKYKQDKLKESSLKYRLDIINTKVWDEDSLIEQQNKMIERFISVFDIPFKYKNNDNWSLTEVINQSFSPLDVDAGEIAESNNPYKFRIVDYSYNVNSWREVFLKFLSFILNSNDFSFNSLNNRQIELFNNETTIIKWKDLKQLVLNKNEISERYKTLNGEFHYNIENLEDEEIFVHINISAKTCILRIKNAMEFFNIPLTAVEIFIKSNIRNDSNSFEN